MDIPSTLLENVTFLETKNEGFFEPIGTAFLVGHEHEGVAFGYLVTCFHVIRDALKTGIQIFARVNLAEEPGITRIPLDANWVFHPENTETDLVDVAVLPLELFEPEKPIDVKLMPSNLMYGNTGLVQLFGRELQVGDDILSMGLFQQFAGNFRNQPITRFGRISLLPVETMAGPEIWLGVSQYFLVECQAYPGMSGSPVFIMKEYKGKEKYFFIGIMAGYYKEDKEAEQKFSHFGISQVVPANKLMDIIFHGRLAEIRNATYLERRRRIYEANKA